MTKQDKIYGALWLVALAIIVGIGLYFAALGSKATHAALATCPPAAKYYHECAADSVTSNSCMIKATAVADYACPTD